MLNSAVGFGIGIVLTFTWLLRIVWQPSPVPLFMRLFNTVACLSMIFMGIVLIRVALTLP